MKLIIRKIWDQKIEHNLRVAYDILTLLNVTRDSV